MKNQTQNRFRNRLRTTDQIQNQIQTYLSVSCGVSGYGIHPSNGGLRGWMESSR